MESLRNKVSQLLRSSERIFKLDMVYLAKGGSWMTLQFVGSSLISIVTIIAFGNLLPRETYGTYSYLLALASSLSFLTLSGASTGVLRATARGQGNILPYAVKLQLRYNIPTVLIVAVIAIYYGLRGNHTFSSALLMLAIAIPLAEVYHVYQSVLIGRKRFDIFTAISILSGAFSVTLTTIALLMTKNIVALVAVYSLTLLASNLFAYLYVKRDLPQGEPDAESISELRRTSFHITGSGLISYLTKYIDKIVLFQVAGPATLAIYGFAIAGPERLKSLLKNLMGISLPRLAEKSLKEIQWMFYKRLSFTLLVGLVTATVYILFSSLFFHLLLPKYLDAIIYTRVYALGLIVVPVSIYVAQVFSGQNMLRAIYIYNAGSQIIRILLFLILGWQWQIWGLVVASIMSYVVNAIFSIIVWEVEVRRLTIKNG